LELSSLSDGNGLEIPEIRLIDQIDDLGKRYKSLHDRAPVNVSHWDPSAETIQALRSSLEVRNWADPVRYRYSYLVDRKDQILKKIGVTSPAEVSALIYENGSTSVAAVANWLALSNIREVTLLRPCYFAIPYNLRRFGIRVRDHFVPRVAGAYHFPKDLRFGERDALWLTNPVYNTGAYLRDVIDELTQFANTGVIVVADETLSLLPSTLIDALAGYPNVIGIYTPHKSLCINALKFSAVVCRSRHEDAFEHWADVISGGLSLSSAAAICHFLSDNFYAYQAAFLHHIECARNWLFCTLAIADSRVTTDVGSRGHFLSVYWPRVPAERGDDLSFVGEMMEATGAALIPGNRSGFDPALGFSYRINLAQDSPQFRAAIARQVQYLTDYSEA
jgi:aspartate/methionine/tyrosine aminotransferase